MRKDKRTHTQRTRKRTIPLLLSSLALLSLVGVGCEDPKQTIKTPEAGSTPNVTPNVSEQATGPSCLYENLFSGAQECKRYTGEGWTEPLIEDDCAGQMSASLQAEACTEEALGRCILEEGAAREVELTFPGDDPTQCEATARGCVVFARGRFEPSAVCEGQFEPIEPPSTQVGGVFEPFELLCQAPEEGAEGDEGACTWQAIGGCAPEGERFIDNASCEPVLTQRPYSFVPPSGFQTPADDPILQDEGFLSEVEWVRSQAESCGCVCCHANTYAPNGAAVWDTDKPGVWTDDFNPRGLAMAAGWLDTSVLGAFPADENNGFDRTVTALPTTDVERMRRFFEGELARRGLSRDDFEEGAPIGGPLYDQLIYEPSGCANGEGVSAEGVVSWVGGEARYVYVLRAGSANPSTPPNLDLPEGTLWRLDVAHTDPALADGFVYGEAPAGARQTFPTEGAPEALTEGERYYLYVLRDVGVPVTRCLFTVGEGAPEPVEVSPPWGDVCAGDEDCAAPTSYCVRSPGQAEGYCSAHCTGASSCAELGAPSSWSCNAINCDVEAFTWCGPASEVEESGGFLKVCP